MARAALLAARIALAAWGIAAVAAPASAEQPPVTVKCAAGQKITDALNAHPAANGALTLLVSGTCTENIVIERFSRVTIKGNPTATLRPVHPTDWSTIAARTRLILDGVTVIGGVNAIFDGPRSFVTLQNSEVKGAGDGIFVHDNSSLDVLNSTIATTGAHGITSELGGTILVQADPGETTEISGAQTGIFCNLAKLDLTTQGNGKVLIHNNKRLGILGLDCGLHTYNPSGTISIAANGTAGSYGAGLEQRGGWADLNDVKILNTRGFAAINAWLNAAVLLQQVTLSGNVAGIKASQGAVVYITPYVGASTIKNNGTRVFSCYQGGQIFVDAIAGSITPAPTPAQLGCLHIGGP
jgi:hypothetical protein